jgi:hypothetical protein
MLNVLITAGSRVTSVSMKQSPALYDIGKVHLPPIDYFHMFKVTRSLYSAQTYAILIDTTQETIP